LKIIPKHNCIANVPPKEGITYLDRQRTQEIDSEIAQIKNQLQPYIDLKDKYVADGKTLPKRHQKRIDELNDKIFLLEKEGGILLEKIQIADAEATADISPALETLCEGKSVPHEAREALAGYKRAREARGVPKAKLIRESAKYSPKTSIPRVREHRSPSKPRGADTGGNGSKNVDSDSGGSDSSDPDQGDPPAPIVRAHYSHSLTPYSKRNKSKYLNRRVYRRSWRMPQNTCGTQREGGRAI
jgi:hypothetical protein